MPSSSPPLTGVDGVFFCRVTAPRLLPLFLGVFGGAFVSLGVALSGVRTAAVVRWMLHLPGDLLLNAFVCLALPATALHAVLTGVQVAREQLKSPQARWVQIAGATLAAFALATLLASLLGALLVVALQSIVPSSALLTQIWGLPEGATVGFVCPDAISNGSMALQSDGTLMCTENATTFVIDDVAQTFVMNSVTEVRSVAEQVVKVAESVFPVSLGAVCVDGDVLSLVVGGLALGAALAGFALAEATQGEDEDSHEQDQVQKEFVLLQLVAQAEALICSVLAWLQKYLPMTVAFMISSVLLQARPSSSSSDHNDDNTAVAVVLALIAVLLLTLVLDVVIMISLAAVFTRSNPFAFLEHLVPAQLLAISSGSSVVALPATVSCIASSKRVSSKLAFIVCSTGTVLNQTGAALYLSVSSLFVLTASRLNSDELAVTQSASTVTAMVFANALIASVVSPLPAGAKTAALATTLGAVFGISTGPRAALLAFLAALEGITGPIVACVNVTNSALVALVIAHYFESQPVADTAAQGTPVRDLRQQRVMGMIHNENWV
ncbi:Sodium:dicarboxylate symporter family [Phytophthora infestans]|uniref:Amino acid transporter n=1 Tax=Phytophthora infestans TaxID=4787 RepID=A0A833SV41_PHYIN|nr:Sodium:dicarboxylate symporter family [Phytophthora infestans]